jgi:hypothetical protein
VPSYERLYQGRAYLGKAEVEPVRREVAELRHRFAVGTPERVLRPPGAVETGETPPDRRRGREPAATRHSNRAAAPQPRAPKRDGQLTLELSTAA